MASSDFVACEYGTLAKLEDQGVPFDQRARCPDCGGLAHEIAVAVHQVIEAKMIASVEVSPKPEEPRH